MILVDFTYVFNTANRTGLWKPPRKHEYPEKFTPVIELLHTGMKARYSDRGVLDIK